MPDGVKNCTGATASTRGWSPRRARTRRQVPRRALGRGVQRLPRFRLRPRAHRRADFARGRRVVRGVPRPGQAARRRQGPLPPLGRARFPHFPVWRERHGHDEHGTLDRHAGPFGVHPPRAVGLQRRQQRRHRSRGPSRAPRPRHAPHRRPPRPAAGHPRQRRGPPGQLGRGRLVLGRQHDHRAVHAEGRRGGRHQPGRPRRRRDLRVRPDLELPARDRPADRPDLRLDVRRGRRLVVHVRRDPADLPRAAQRHDVVRRERRRAHRAAARRRHLHDGPTLAAVHGRGGTNTSASNATVDASSSAADGSSRARS